MDQSHLAHGLDPIVWHMGGRAADTYNLTYLCAFVLLLIRENIFCCIRSAGHAAALNILAWLHNSHL